MAAVRKLLRRRGVDLEAGKGTDCGTPLYAAAYAGHAPIVDLLLRAGADVNGRCNEGSTPLVIAAANGRAAVARALIAAGADLNAHTSRGDTPLDYAVDSGALEIVQILIDAGADIHSAAHDGGITVLHRAAKSNEPGLIPYLLAAGAGCYLNHPSNPSRTLFTPLIVACSVGNKAAVEHLLEAGADLEAKSKLGATALHWAAVRDEHEIVELLIAAGADVEAADDDGETPIDYAVGNGYRRVAALLQAAAARKKRKQEASR